MGSLLPALVGFNILWKNQLLGPAKMLAFISLASLIALSQAAILPAGVSAASCVNYPFCGPSPDDGAYLVPGLAAHAAALNAQLARMGVPAGQPAHDLAL